MCSFRTIELIKAIVDIMGLYSINKHNTKTLITSNKCVTDPKCLFNKNYFNRKGSFNVMSRACSLDEKCGIERPFISFHFTVFLMVLFKNKLDE